MAREVGPAAGTDATGGMRLRLVTAATLARVGVASWILDGRTSGLVGAALTGEIDAGTHIPAE
jgi:isopentenyl phosphate kinase